jgi:hypothetical protein
VILRPGELKTILLEPSGESVQSPEKVAIPETALTV